MEKIEVNITTPYIKLDQLLKFSGIAESGADAKDIVSLGMVELDGEICTMRGKKIYAGMKITVYFEDETVEVCVVE